MTSPNAVKGMQDVLPPEVHLWRRIEEAAVRVFGSYGFHELRSPILEYTHVFSRGIGEQTDIVEKEMYTFDDKGGRSVSMRPEGTASIVRAYVQHHLSRLSAPQKYFYTGPMFRYERPQKGRLRQFHQVGAEAFGLEGPAIDAEVIGMLMAFLTSAGLGGLSLEINSIGCPECRPAYREALVKFFEPVRAGLCEDCGRRLVQNPLRVLDCKVPKCRELRLGAPVVSEHLCGACDEHFNGLRALLDRLGVSYKINPEMVRGLDYYTRTTFEVTTDRLGAQSAVAAGGRYNSLVKEFGGPETPAIGFAVGMERMAALLMEDGIEEPAPQAFIVPLGQRAEAEALALAAKLRTGGQWIEVGSGGSLKSQLRRADKLRARFAIIMGENELDKGEVNIKDMAHGTAADVAIDSVAGFIDEHMKSEAGS